MHWGWQMVEAFPMVHQEEEETDVVAASTLGTRLLVEFRCKSLSMPLETHMVSEIESPYILSLGYGGECGDCKARNF